MEEYNIERRHYAMKALILDIDGVLNTFTSREQDKINGMAHNIDPDKAKLVRDIRAKTGCIIALSSTWKNFYTDMAELIATGVFNPQLDHVIAPLDPPATRGDEIEAWLVAKHVPWIHRYVIVDDHNTMLPDQQDHLIQTRSFEGLTRFQANCIMKMLEPTLSDFNVTDEDVGRDL